MGSYPEAQRRVWMAMPDSAFSKTRTAANADRPTLRTVQRWRRLQRAGASLAPGQSSGRPRRLVALIVSLVHYAKAARPTLQADQIIRLIAAWTGMVLSRPDVSRCLLHYNPHGRMSRKKVVGIAPQRCPLAERLWHEQPPPLGHVGLARERLIDIDEMGVYITRFNNKQGHAYVG